MIVLHLWLKLVGGFLFTGCALLHSSVQFNRVSTYSEKPICILPSLSSFPGVTFESSNTGLIGDGPSSSTVAFYMPLSSRPLIGMASSSSILQISGTQVTCDGCFSCQSVCSVIALSSMPLTVNLSLLSLKMATDHANFDFLDTDHCHMLILTSSSLTIVTC